MDNPKFSIPYSFGKREKCIYQGPSYIFEGIPTKEDISAAIVDRIEARESQGYKSIRDCDEKNPNLLIALGTSFVFRLQLANGFYYINHEYSFSEGTASFLVDKFEKYEDMVDFFKETLSKEIRQHEVEMQCLSRIFKTV